jgi:hypothetical protein
MAFAPITAPPLPERRSEPRYRCHRICHARPNGTALGVSWGATVLNLSVRGALLELRQPLSAGTILALQLAGDGPAAPLLARVIRVTRWGERWLCGCALVKPLAVEQLRDWLA